MFNEFRKGNILSEFKFLTILLTTEVEKLKELETVDIPIENKKQKLEEIKQTIDRIKSQIDKLKLEIKLDGDFKNN